MKYDDYGGFSNKDASETFTQKEMEYQRQEMNWNLLFLSELCI